MFLKVNMNNSLRSLILNLNNLNKSFINNNLNKFNMFNNLNKFHMFNNQFNSQYNNFNILLKVIINRLFKVNIQLIKVNIINIKLIMELIIKLIMELIAFSC